MPSLTPCDLCAQTASSPPPPPPSSREARDVFGDAGDLAAATTG